jgi:deoxyribonuclease V
MDLETAISLILRLTRFRQPETTRRAHQLVNDARRAYKASLAQAEGEASPGVQPGG